MNKLVKASQVERHYTTREEDSHRNNIAKIMYTKYPDKDDNKKVDKLPKFDKGVFKYKQYQSCHRENKLIRQCTYFDKTFNMTDLYKPTNLNMASIVFNGIKYKHNYKTYHTPETVYR